MTENRIDPRSVGEKIDAFRREQAAEGEWSKINEKLDLIRKNIAQMKNTNRVLFAGFVVSCFALGWFASEKTQASNATECVALEIDRRGQ